MAVSDWVYDSKKGAYVRDFSTAAKGVELGDYQPTPFEVDKTNADFKKVFTLDQGQQDAFSQIWTGSKKLENANRGNPYLNTNFIEEFTISSSNTNLFTLSNYLKDFLPIIDPIIEFYYATNPNAASRVCRLKARSVEVDELMGDPELEYHHDDDNDTTDGISQLMHRLMYMNVRDLDCYASDLFIVSNVIGTVFKDKNGADFYTNAHDVIMFNGLTEHSVPFDAPEFIGREGELRTTLRLRFGDPLLFEPIIEP